MNEETEYITIPTETTGLGALRRLGLVVFLSATLALVVAAIIADSF